MLFLEYFLTLCMRVYMCTKFIVYVLIMSVLLCFGIVSGFFALTVIFHKPQTRNIKLSKVFFSFQL